MAETRNKHPSWFKMKLERRELIRQLSPETAVNVLLACWDYLETGERPGTLSPIESVAFASFMPDMEEAWNRYLVRVTSGAQGGRPPKGKKPYGSICPHTVPYGTEEETEPETEEETEPKKGCGAASPPTRSRFVPPTLEEVTAYVRERGGMVDPQGFIDFYAAKGWMVGRNKMKDWKAACRNAEKWERWQRGSSRNGVKAASDYESGDDFFTR